MNTSPPYRKSLLYGFLFFGLILLFAFPLSFHQIYANDIWKALYSGRYLSVFQQFPHHSTFTYSPVKDFLVRDTFNWLGNLVLLGVFRAGGAIGLQGLRFAFVLFAVLLPLSLSSNRRNPMLLLFLICFLFGIEQKLLMRTAIFVVPGITLLFWFLMRFEIETSPNYLWGIPVVFLFWSSMHGSYIVGLILLILAWFGGLLDVLRNTELNALYRPLRVGLILLLSLVVVTFVKPFPDYTFWNKTTGMVQRVERSVSTLAGGLSFGNIDSEATNSSGISRGSDQGSSTAQSSVSGKEKSSLLQWSFQKLRQMIISDRPWRSNEFSFPLSEYSFLFVSMTMALFPLGFAVFWVGDRFRFFHFLPFLGAFFLSVSYLRTIGYFPLVLLPITLTKARFGDFDRIKIGGVVQYASVFAVAILSLNMTYYAWKGNVAAFFGSPEMELRAGYARRFSPNVPNYVLRKYPSERVYTPYNVSGYLIWKWWPYKQVIFDTKGSAYTDDFFREFGANHQKDLMDRYNIDFVINPYHVPYVFSYYIPDRDWHLLAYDSGMMFFGRATKVEPVESFRALLLSEEEYRSLRPKLRYAVNYLTRYLHKNQNVGNLIWKSRDTSAANATDKNSRTLDRDNE